MYIGECCCTFMLMINVCFFGGTKEGWDRYIGYLYKLIYFIVYRFFPFRLSRLPFIFKTIFKLCSICDFMIKKFIRNSVICLKS